MLAVGGLGLLLATVVLFVDYYFYKGKYFAEMIKEYGWYIVMGLTVATVGLTLLYSEYFGFIPCSLCWLQRIAAYPQALMSILAFRMKDQVFFPVYGIALSIFGLLAALYQYIFFQMWPKQTDGEVAPCLLDGSNADCAAKIINEFGFVTFPFISAVSFAFLIMIYLYMLRQK